MQETYPDMARLSVVILTYNSEKTLSKCIKSLEGQNCQDFELVVADGGSTDNTLEIILKSQLKGKTAITLYNNTSFSEGRNVGIRNSDSEYIAFLDSDAYPTGNWVKNIISAFNKSERLGVVGGKELPFYSTPFSYSLALIDNSITEIFRKREWKIKGCNFAVRKSIALAIGGFNEAYPFNEEQIFIRHAKKLGFEVMFDETISVLHERRRNPSEFAKQQFIYGYRTFRTSLVFKKHLIDFMPSVLMVSFALSIFFPLLGLLTMFLILFKSFFVLLYKKESIRFLPHILLGWLIKDIFWGIGGLTGLVSRGLYVNKRLKSKQ